MKANNILELIGNTPLLNISSLFDKAKEKNIQIWIKLEKQNPAGSIKDRIALAMIERAEQEGVITQSSEIIEPTSGNTGIGLAMVCATKGYSLTLVMPETMSIERRKIMELYGAKIVLSPGGLGMKGAIALADELKLKEKNSFIPMQFENMANPQQHYDSTANEILEDLPHIDYMVSGVGTGGHISGISKKIKVRLPNLKVYAVEPTTSAVLSGSSSGPHKIQGIGTGFIPQTLSLEVIDSIVTISNEEAFHFFKLSPKQIGLSIGISTGANLAAIEKIMDTLIPDSILLTFCYDSADKYFSLFE